MKDASPKTLIIATINNPSYESTSVTWNVYIKPNNQNYYNINENNNDKKKKE